MDDDETEIQTLNATDQQRDMLSSLSDDILLHILSFLSSKLAITTSTLSKRWKYLWVSLPNFSFSQPNFSFHDFRQRLELKASFLDSIEKALVHRNAQCLGEVSLSLESHVIEPRFNSWLSAVAEHRIQTLILDLPHQINFVLPHSFSNSELLRNFYLRLHSGLRLPNLVCFSSLKCLKLVDVSFHDEQSPLNLFFGCPILEELSLKNCYWDNISEITIWIPTLRALTFEEDHLIRDHFFGSKLLISAMNLETFKVSGYTSFELVPSNPPRLDCASININDFNGGRDLSLSIVQLLSGLRDVTYLTLSNQTLESLRYVENIQAALPTFNRLTSLYGFYDQLVENEYTNTAMVYIVEKSPKLRTLQLPRGFKPGEEGKMLETVPHCFVSCLRRFHISDFDGDAGDISLLEHVYKNAPRLKRLSMDCKPNLSADLQKQEEIHQQLRQLREGSASCSIKFIPFDAPTQ